jgi:hypothetical protein
LRRIGSLLFQVVRRQAFWSGGHDSNDQYGAYSMLLGEHAVSWFPLVIGAVSV